MIRYFKYELKKNFWTLVVLTVIAVAVYQVALSTSDFFYRYTDYEGIARIANESTQIGVVFASIGVFAFVVPVLMYSFKMNKRSVDEFYSLPIKREKLYLVKTMVGLLLVFIPYTLAYWTGFLHVVCRENYFHLGYYVPGYFGGLLFGLCLYGINAFTFTRANRVVDGIIFMVAYAFVGGLFWAAWNEMFAPKYYYFNEENFISFVGLIKFGNNIDELIRRGSEAATVKWQASAFAYLVLFAAFSYGLSFFLLRFEKGENAEQNSDSWFGYRILIPIYAFLLSISSGASILAICMIVVGSIVMMIVYNRKVLFHWRYWTEIAVSVALGIIILYAVA